MNKKYIKQPLKGITVTDSAVGTRTPNILMGEHAGEYVRGDMMDANATMQAVETAIDGLAEPFVKKVDAVSFDWIKQSIENIISQNPEPINNTSETTSKVSLAKIKNELKEKIASVFNSHQSIAEVDDEGEGSVDDTALGIKKLLDEHLGGFQEFSNWSPSGSDFQNYACTINPYGYSISQLLALSYIQEALGIYSPIIPTLFSCGITFTPEVFYMNMGENGASITYDTNLLISGSSSNNAVNESVKIVSSTGENWASCVCLGNKLLKLGYVDSDGVWYKFKDSNNNTTIIPTWEFTSFGTIKAGSKSSDYVFASGDFKHIGDNGDNSNYGLIAPLSNTEHDSVATNCFVPNVYIRNVRSLSPEAQITYNNKTYTLNMNKAIELGLFVEASTASVVSEETVSDEVNTKTTVVV